MKRILPLLLTIIQCVGLCACQPSGLTDPTTPGPTTPTKPTEETRSITGTVVEVHDDYLIVEVVASSLARMPESEGGNAIRVEQIKVMTK